MKKEISLEYLVGIDGRLYTIKAKNKIEAIAKVINVHEDKNIDEICITNIYKNLSKGE